MRRAALRKGVLLGALAGGVGGLVFGAAMSQLGILPTIASLVHARSAEIGFLVHMVIAAIVGGVFGALVWQQRIGVGETLFWGLTYGTLWWFLGPLTLLPLLLGAPLVWSVGAAQAAFPSLLGHLLYGASTALALVVLRRDRRPQTGTLYGPVLRGALAGLTASWVLHLILKTQGQTLAFMAIMSVGSHPAGRLGVLAGGLLAGVGFALLYPRPTDSIGPGLVRGMMYGFLWWVAGRLTLMPVIEGHGLAWALASVREHFSTFPGYLLFGVGMALVYRWLTMLVKLLFSDEIDVRNGEGMGTRGLRAMGRGAFAGLVGGLIFTVVMVQMGVLPIVARLIGSSSTLTGFVVHLVIADLIGASYGLLFARQSYDFGSAVGWGVSYGFLWWILGPLTLMPILLGAAPKWTTDVAAGLFPSLVGHLAYGAGLGATFHVLEARYNPWWIPHTQREAARAARRKEHVLTSAPALWALVVVIALTLPIVLTCGDQGLSSTGSSMDGGGSSDVTLSTRSTSRRQSGAVTDRDPGCGPRVGPGP